MKVKKKLLTLKMSDDELIKIIFIVYLSAIMIGRSLFFLTVDRISIYKSNFYHSITQELPKDALSIMLLLAGIMILSTIFSNNIISHISFVLGNLIATIIYFQFTKSGLSSGTNWWTPYANTVNLYVHTLLLIWSIFIIWKKKNQT